MTSTGQLEPGDIPGEATPEQWQELIAMFGSETAVRNAAMLRWPGRSFNAPLLAVEAQTWLREPTEIERSYMIENPTLADIARLGIFGLDEK